MTMKTIYLTTCLVTIVAVTGCSPQAKENMGITRTAPDEFSVVTRAPLSVPPDYTLRPPTPGTQRPMEISTQDVARQSVFGKSDVNKAGNANTATPSGSFLDKVGASDSDPTIRQVVDSEVNFDNADNRPTAEKLMFWRQKNINAGTPIDPVAEKKRLDAAATTAIKKRNEDIEAP